MDFTLEPVTGKGFVNREEIVNDMVRELSDKESNIGFAMYGSRRVGKSSIFKEVQRRLERENDIVTVYLNIWNLLDETILEFSKTLTESIIDAYAPKLGLKYTAKDMLNIPLRILRDAMKSATISIQITEDIEAVLRFQDRKKVDLGLLLEEVFELSEKLAKETNTKCILFIDEFPSIMDLKLYDKKAGEQIVKKIRTIDEQQEHTVLCISGSIRKTMAMVAFSPTSAFYKQLVVKWIKPLEEKYVRELIFKHIPKSNISEKAIKRIYEFSNGIPFYVQFIGRGLRGREKIDEGNVNKIMDEFLREEGNLIFNRDLRQLSPKEKNIVINMALYDIHAPAEIRKRTGTDSASVVMFLGYLEEKGVILKMEKGIYEFEDPIFKMWIAWRYGG